MRFVAGSKSMWLLAAVAVMAAGLTGLDGRGRDAAAASGAGTFVPLQPSRILDTRFGVGAPTAKVGPNHALVVDVTGVGGVPAVGVSAVVVNATVTEPSAVSFVTVYPSDASRPTASNLNVVPGQTVPNLVTSKVGADGSIRAYNAAGSLHLILDVVGYFTEAGATAGSLFHPLAPSRILDTRSDAPIGPAGTRTTTVVGVGGVPASGVSAVVMNVTVTEPTADSYLTVYPAGGAPPTASNLNYAPGTSVPNLVVAKVSPDGRVSSFNAAGTTHLIFDVVGWFGPTTATDGARFSGLTPARLLDTRPGSALAADVPRSLRVVGVGGVPSSGVGAVVLNVTVTEPVGGGFLTVHPGGVPRPLASNLNYVPGQTVPNLVVAKVGEGGDIALYASGGPVHVIVDVVGWFTSVPIAGPPTFPADASLQAVDVARDRLLLSFPPAVDDEAVVRYEVSHGDAVLATLPPSADQHLVTGLAPDTTYSLAVRAFDAAGGSAALSTTVRTIDAEAPLDVTLTPDPRGHNQGTVKEAIGGTSASEAITYAVRGPDGTTYQLTLEPGSLLSDEDIRMQPLVGAQGLPDGVSLVAGISLEPEGLLLNVPGTLTITPPASAPAVPVEEELTMASDHMGRGVHLVPIRPDVRPWTFQIGHFSEYLVGRGSQAQRSAIVRQVRDREQEHLAAMQEVLAAERNVQLVTGGPSDPEAATKLRDRLNAYYREVVLPILIAALTNEELAGYANQIALGYQRQRQLVGLSEDPEADRQEAVIADYLRRITQNVYDRALERCVENADPREGVILLSIERQRQLSGMSDETDGSFSQALQCLEQRLVVTYEATTELLDGPEDLDPLFGPRSTITLRAHATVVPRRPNQGDDPVFYGNVVPTLSGASIATRAPSGSTSICARDGEDPLAANRFPIKVRPLLNPTREVHGRIEVRADDHDSRIDTLPDSGWGMRIRFRIPSADEPPRCDVRRTRDYYRFTSYRDVYGQRGLTVPVDGSRTVTAAYQNFNDLHSGTFTARVERVVAP